MRITSIKRLVENTEEYITLPFKDRTKWGIFYRTPLALEHHEWKKCNDFLKKMFPVQFFIREVALAEIGYLWRRLGWFCYYVKCLLFKRYHVIKLDLSPCWHDKNHLMEKALEKLLIDFVEQEEPFKHIDWDSDSAHKEAEKVIRKCYDFFTYIAPRKLEEIEQLEAQIVFDLGAPPSEKQLELHNKIWKLEEKLENEKTDMYVSLILVRNYLWT